MSILWNVNVTVIPVVIRALGTVWKNLVKNDCGNRKSVECFRIPENR